MSTITTTYNLAGLNPNATYHASVISANPSATALFLDCVGDQDNCQVLQATATFGDWAQITPAPTVSTGILDLIVTIDAEGGSGETDTASSVLTSYLETLSAHCTVTQTTQASVCTYAYLGKESNKPATTTTFASDEASAYPATAIPVTITAGAEKLSSGGASTTSSGGASTTSGSGSTSTTSSAPLSSSSHSGASSGRGVSVSAVGLTGLLLTLFAW